MIVNKTNFSSLPKVIAGYVFEIESAPTARKVSKHWKACFDQYCYRKWKTIENDKKAPEDFTNRLTVFREEFEKTHSEWKGNGFLLIREFFRQLPKRWAPHIFKLKGVEFNNLCNVLRKAWGIELLLDFAGMGRFWENYHNGYVLHKKREKPAKVLRAVKQAFKWLENYQSKTLSLGSSGLNGLPWSIGQLAIKTLVLSENQLTTLPATFCNMPHLVSLDLSHNRITQFPLVLCFCKQLNFLSLFHNEIKEIPKEIDELKQLKILDLGHNDIKELPKEICQLPNLQQLSLIYNHLTELPSEICYLKLCLFLCIDNNPVFKKTLVRIPVISDLSHNKYTLRHKTKKQAQDALEKELGRFFNVEALKEERAFWASSPLGKLYQDIIFKDMERQKRVLLIEALSVEDRNLFYGMIVMASTIFDESFVCPETLKEQLQWGKQNWVNLGQQALDWAIKETIIQKYKELDENTKSGIGERIKLLAKKPNINDPNQIEELVFANLPRLADAMEINQGSCVLC